MAERTSGKFDGVTGRSTAVCQLASVSEAPCQSACAQRCSGTTLPIADRRTSLADTDCHAAGRPAQLPPWSGRTVQTHGLLRTGAPWSRWRRWNPAGCSHHQDRSRAHMPIALAQHPFHVLIWMTTRSAWLPHTASTRAHVGFMAVAHARMLCFSPPVHRPSQPGLSRLSVGE